MAVLLFVMVLLLLFLGVPVAIALGLSSILYIYLFSNDSISSIAIAFFSAAEHYTLLAIPFFILSSAFMSSGGVARRMVRFSIAVVGHFRGGLAMAGVFSCMLFAALSGSSPATVLAIGTIVIAGMRKAGYKLDFAAGVICNAGTLGILIPPSIVMVVYAAATDVSVGRMFLAGIVPGLLAGLMLMFGIYLVALKRNIPSIPWQGWQEVLSSGKEAIWGLLLIVIILGGIYGGIFTPTEAAAVAAVYSFIIANYVYRDMGPWAEENNQKQTSLIHKILLSFVHSDNYQAILGSAKITVMLMFIIVNALLFAHVLTSEGIPQLITDTMLAAGLDKWSFLVIVNLLLLLGGQFMEPSGLILITAPVILPLALELGIDPIHLGIIMVVNMEIGMITPPVGLNLFVTSSITGMSIARVVKAALPWLGILMIFLLLITYIPEISLLVPTALMGKETINL